MIANVHPITSKQKRSSAEKEIWKEAVMDAKMAAVDYLKENFTTGWSVSGLANAIDAACLPPSEPEIEVTEAMVIKGREIQQAAQLGSLHEAALARAIYVAMERQRRADEKQGDGGMGE